MESLISSDNVTETAAVIGAEINALAVLNNPSLRVIRRRVSTALKTSGADFVLRLAKKLLAGGTERWFAYELIQNHKASFARLNPAELEELGQGINSWSSVDEFARILAGPAWLIGQVPDELILTWAHSTDRWWRRAALVSTVALNMPSQGGRVDVARTLQVCRLLIEDHDNMVAKAMSWALRVLGSQDARAVQQFLDEYGKALDARVKREVRHKLNTGLKNPRRIGKRMSKDNPEMTAQDVIEFVEMLNQHQIGVCVDGGWGVDALLGEQTRRHADLDIAVEHKDVPAIRALLEARGYSDMPRGDTRDCNFVMGDELGHLIDFHSYTYDEQGNLIFGLAYPLDSLRGRGTVAGFPVQCITPEWMVKFHTGYTVDADDYHDVKAICLRFGIPIPVEYASFEEKS